jgi:hypothetical protein
VVHEDVAGRDDDFEQAHGLLQRAEGASYSGFGYASVKVFKIGPGSHRDGKDWMFETNSN